MTTSSPLDPVLTVDEVGERAALRAGAHAVSSELLRVAQRWQHGVTDIGVARVMLALEFHHVRPYRNRTGRWYAPSGSPLANKDYNLGTTISEMVRTGLVRHWRDRDGDHLIPAPVHLLERTTMPTGLVTKHSACLFVGEDLGPMRSRLVDRLDLVDCLACESAVAIGSFPRL